MNLPNAVLYKSLDQLNLANQSLVGEITFENFEWTMRSEMGV